MAHGGTELSRVVDEDSDEEQDGRRANDGAGRGGYDLDSIFAYQTYRMVRIKDRYLGFMYWSIVVVVIMYVIVVVFNIRGMHSERDQGFGTVIVRFKGKAFANGKVFDEADLRFPAIEPSGAFVMTKRIVMKNQRISNCVDMDSPRKCPCMDGVQCIDGRCATEGWCPSLGDMNADSPPPGAVVERLEGLEDAQLQIVAGITFPGIGNRFYVAGDSPFGTDLYKNITLGELVGFAEPKVKFEDVLEKGALISMAFSWKCDVTADCEPSVVIKHLDGGQGFVQKRAWHHRHDGELCRDAMYMYGIRVLVDSQGVGRKISLVLIVIQAGSALALLRLSSMITDQFMLVGGCFRQRREAYYKCKIIETRDYSDLQDRINKEDVKVVGRPGASSSAAASGVNVHFGLGPGARGGVASTLVRGRAQGN